MDSKGYCVVCKNKMVETDSHPLGETKAAKTYSCTGKLTGSNCSREIKRIEKVTPPEEVKGT